MKIDRKFLKIIRDSIENEWEIGWEISGKFVEGSRESNCKWDGQSKENRLKIDRRFQRQSEEIYGKFIENWKGN